MSCSIQLYITALAVASIPRRYDSHEVCSELASARKHIYCASDSRLKLFAAYAAREEFILIKIDGEHTF